MSSNNQIIAAFKKIEEALNNPKLREEFLNGNKQNETLNKIVGIFDRRTTVYYPRMIQSQSKHRKNLHVPAGVGNQCVDKKWCVNKHQQKTKE